MKKYPITLISAAAALLWLSSIGAAHAESPTPARRDLDKVKENTRAFDGSAPGKGGSTIDTTVRPSTGTVPSAPVRPSTTTAPATALTKPATTKPNPAPSSIDRIYVPPPVVKPAPAPQAPVVKTQPAPQTPVVKTQPAPETKEKPKAKPTTGTVPTGN
jgi:hypothetical protein